MRRLRATCLAGSLSSPPPTRSWGETKQLRHEIPPQTTATHITLLDAAVGVGQILHERFAARTRFTTVVLCRPRAGVRSGSEYFAASPAFGRRYRRHHLSASGHPGVVDLGCVLHRYRGRRRLHRHRSFRHVRCHHQLAFFPSSKSPPQIPPPQVSAVDCWSCCCLFGPEGVRRSCRRAVRKVLPRLNSPPLPHHSHSGRIPSAWGTVRQRNGLTPNSSRGPSSAVRGPHEGGSRLELLQPSFPVCRNHGGRRYRFRQPQLRHCASGPRRRRRTPERSLKAPECVRGVVPGQAALHGRRGLGHRPLELPQHPRQHEAPHWSQVLRG
mmetsp:Transcript_16154/g.37658  ORF Transcript_16154/g.37658 Transcript_16154/m.37658 type:complete len:326 (+) Transcript_16154:179-1156(+)